MEGKNLVLFGFMGCGKTSAGKRAAKTSSRRFVDMDEYIEERQGLKITEIFARDGEEAFRLMELEAARALSLESGLVLAAGGGAVLRAETASALKSNGALLFLDVPLAVLCRRLKSDISRPLLQVPNRNAVIASLYEQRKPLYLAAADAVVQADSSLTVVAARALQIFSTMEVIS